MKKQIVRTCLIASALMLAMTTEASAKSICLDPGHGGSDPGAGGCSMVEAHNVLDSAKRLKALFEAAGWTVYMTRTTDTYVGLSERASYANGKGVTTFASIHNNAFNGSATGIETLCQPGYMSAKDGQQAKAIQNGMISIWSLANRGAKEQNLAVTRQTTMTATLSELAFIDNCSKDAPYLKSSDQVQKAMQEHCKAITKLFDGAANSACSGSGGGGTQPPAQQTGKLMAGTFKNSVAQENWLGGVKYSVGGKSQTSASSYTMMTFELPVGSYKATASKDGYNTASKDCEPVTTSAVSWCSIALTPAQAEVKKGKATGQVKDSVSGSKVAAKVAVSGGASANYDGNTDWSFDLDPGTYTITATADGYDSGNVSCTVTSDKSTSCPISINPKKGTITGNVYDANSNQKVKSTVTIGAQHLEYDGNNTFSFTVEAGTYTISAAAPEYDTAQVSCTVAKGGTQNCDLKLNPKKASSGTLKGTVSDAETGALIAATVKTDDDHSYIYSGQGSFEFTLDPREYTVTATSEGYETGSTKCTVVSGQVVDCPIKLQAGNATVTGTVFSSTDPSKHIAATVSVNGTTIDYDGNTNWTTSLKPGKYTFSATTADGSKGSTSCNVEAGKVNECNIAIIPSGAKTGVLNGIVYDSRSDQLTLNALVQVDGYGEIQYNGEGRFSFENLPTGQHKVTASADGYYTNIVTCEVVDVGESYCAIPLTFKPSEGATNAPDWRYPRISVTTVACSTETLSQNHSIPFGMAAFALGLITVLGIRRRKGEE